MNDTVRHRGQQVANVVVFVLFFRSRFLFPSDDGFWIMTGETYVPGFFFFKWRFWIWKAKVQYSTKKKKKGKKLKRMFFKMHAAIFYFQLGIRILICFSKNFQWCWKHNNCFLDTLYYMSVKKNIGNFIYKYSVIFVLSF